MVVFQNYSFFFGIELRQICDASMMRRGVKYCAFQLHALLKALTRKEVGAIKTPAKTTFDCLGNLNVCFEFMKKEEGLRIVNIGARASSCFNVLLIEFDIDAVVSPVGRVGAADLKEGNKKLALGLVWMLILNYQIYVAAPVASATSSGGGSGSGSGGAGNSIGGSSAEKRRSGEFTESSAKKILLDW
jgi:hypothetical protein